MAAATGSKAAAKRKRDPKVERPRKRSRSISESENESDDDLDLQDRIVRLESEILESKKHYNNIVSLVEIAQRESQSANTDDNDDDNKDKEDGPKLTAIVSLCRVFLRLLAAGSLTLSKDLSPKEVVVVHWLRERLTEVEAILLGAFAQSGPAASAALTLSMRLVQAEGQYLRNNSGKDKDTSKDGKKKKSDGEDDNNSSSSSYVFPQAFFNQLVRNIVLARQRLGAEAAEELAEEFVGKFVSEHCDVRFYTFRAITAALGDAVDKETTVDVASRVDGAFGLLSLIDDVPESSEALDSFYVRPPPAKKNHALRSVVQHKRQAQDAWVALLRQATDKAQRKRALSDMATVIAPWFTQPELLLDYLTDCYNAGGATSLLALSGLYFLIRERNVDYPAFYPKLYSLLDGDILHSKHRSRFFRLLDAFLASTHLPAQLVASFIKRLARLCLHAPPSAIVTVVPWIYNMLKKHPLCSFMIHRVPRTEEERAALERDGLADPFRPEEADPMETQAIDSCLWEVVQLQSHYHPNVATIAKIISEQFTKQSYNVEDFLDHSYQSMFDAEIGKEVKKAPVIEFHIPKRVFLPQDSASGVEDSFLVKLWDFS